MTGRVNASVNGVKSPDFQAPCDGTAPEADRLELRPADHPVLQGRELRDPPIEGRLGAFCIDVMLKSPSPNIRPAPR